MNAPLIREPTFNTLRQSNQWDVIVIGGGATGLGTAVEAASRGYKTLLLEKYDFAKGTSSRSTKLVHGGVRYLAQGNLSLVREALHERGVLRRNAPHLVKDLSFVVPGYAWWSQLYYGAGLKLYDLLSGRLSLGHSRFLNKQDTLEYIPTLKQEGLRGGILYHDGQFDDARLAITLMRTLFDWGGIALNYAPVIDLIKTEEKVTGVRAQDTETGEIFELKGKVIVNATGVFVDTIRRMDDPSVQNMLSPSQGIHVVVDQRFLPGNSAMMIPKTEDGRVLFALPWHGKTVVGTTDTPVEQPEYEPRPLDAEIDFILRTIAQYLCPAPTRVDVLSVFVGQRPLVKAEHTASTAALSREHTIRISSSGLLTITGGKWTTYRKMGEDVIDQVVQQGKLPPQPSVTETLRLHGWTQTPVAAPLDVYGSDAAKIEQMPGADQLLHSRLPYTEAEVRWAVRYEMARTVEDVLSRRTRSLLLDAAASLEAAPRVASLLAEELKLDAAWQQQQIAAYRSLASGYQLKYAEQSLQPTAIPLRATNLSLPISTTAPDQVLIALTDTTTKLSQWLQSTFEQSWQAIDQLINPEADLLFGTRSLESGVRRGKLINLGMQLGQQTVALLVNVTSEPEGKLAVLVQLYPTGEARYLLPELKLSLRSSTGKTLQEVTSRSQDNYIQLKPFRGRSGKRFSVAIHLGSETIEENFEL